MIIFAVIAAVSCSNSKKNNPDMTYRINPHSGDKVSLIGFGCMRFPMKEDANGNEIIDQETVNLLVDSAINWGINYFDCAPVYLNGECEKSAGIALKRHNRKDFLVATKLSNHHSDRHDLEFAKEMYYNSFKNLQVDYIDYYLLHSVGGGDGIETFNARFIDNGLLDFLLEEKKAGRIRNLGWSFHGDVAVFDKMFELGIQWDFAQIQMNYMDWRNASTDRNVNAEYLYNKCVENNVPVVIMEPLLGGRLASLSPYARKVLEDVNPNSTPVEWALRYVGSYDKVLTVLSGMNKIEHVRENVKVYSPLVSLTEDDNKALEAVTEIMTTEGFITCTGCDYCVPCPFGVNIPEVFSAYNKYISERIDIDKNDPILQQASQCQHCKLCEGKCPQRIGISDKMEKIDSIIKAK